jgi:hypothetical protein
MKRLILCASFLLGGCATQVVPLNVPGIERSEAARVQDLRPATEKESEIFSLSITNEAYALYRVADAVMAPPPIRLLQHRAFETFESRGAPADIKVRHLVVYRNLQAGMRKAVLGQAIGGLIGAAVAGKAVTDPSGMAHSLVDASAFDALEKTEYKRAQYSAEENPGRGPVYIIYVETEVNGTRAFTRTLAPHNGKEGENPLVKALEAAVAFNIAQHR